MAEFGGDGLHHLPFIVVLAHHLDAVEHEAAFIGHRVQADDGTVAVGRVFYPRSNAEEFGVW